MANNYTLSGSAWVDLNTVLGVAVGTEFNIQNVSSWSFYIRESSTLPTEVDGAVVFPPSYDTLSKAFIAAGSDKIWVKMVDVSKSTKIALF